MKVIIVGAGSVGTELISRLTKEEHDIVVVDSAPKKLEEAVNHYDVKGVLGNGASYEVLEEAGAGNADIIIACTPHDELNILSCMVAKKLNAKETIARTRTPEYFSLFQGKELELSMMVNPEYEAAMDIAASLKFLAAIKVEPFAEGRVNLAEVKVGEGDPLDGVELKDLASKVQVKVLICAVEREGKVFIPTGNFRLQADDDVYFTAASEQTATFFKAISDTKTLRSAMIVGGGTIAYYLALELRKMGIRVKIIEQDEARCKFLSENLHKVEIVQGDGTDQDLLMDEGLSRTSAFIATGRSDEQNIILAMFARTKKVKKVIAKVDNTAYYKMLRTVGLENVFSSRATTADQIVRYIRSLQDMAGGNVKKLHQIVNGQAEALEFVVSHDFAALGKPLKDIKLDKNIIIATIIRKDEIIIPDGNSVILEGDTVVVVTTTGVIEDFNDILE